MIAMRPDYRLHCVWVLPNVVVVNILIVLIALSVAAFLAFSKKLSGSKTWKATLTPLASIMGSGFLVCAPLIGGIAGPWSVLFMLILLVMAYCVGEVVRYNIRYFEPIEHKNGTPQKIAFLSRIVLSLAYFISVAYYLQLLSTFALTSFGIDEHLKVEFLTTTILAVIAFVGVTKGLRSLEGLEKYAISLNLGMITALLVALATYNIGLFTEGNWKLPPSSPDMGAYEFRVLLGLLIVVQGFETSRYLGDEHPAEQRIKTMRYAQWISTVIYILFIGLMTVLFEANMDAKVTEVIKLTAPIAAVLPILLTVAAIGSQFSASVADDAAAGGLLEDLFSIKPKIAYAIVMAASISVVWLTSVNEVIAVASRAFALFYCLQALVAALLARKETHHGRCFFFIITAVLCLMVTIFGVPAG